MGQARRTGVLVTDPADGLWPTVARPTPVHHVTGPHAEHLAIGPANAPSVPAGRPCPRTPTSSSPNSFSTSSGDAPQRRNHGHTSRKGLPFAPPTTPMLIFAVRLEFQSGHLDDTAL